MQDIATEIMPLTPENVTAVIESVGAKRAESAGPGTERRMSARWQFDGVVEFRDDGADDPEFGTLGNISEGGLCMKCDHDVAIGGSLDLAIHTDAATLTGSGTVMGSHEAHDGWLVRVRFDI